MSNFENLNSVLTQTLYSIMSDKVESMVDLEKIEGIVKDTLETAKTTNLLESDEFTEAIQSTIFDCLSQSDYIQADDLEDMVDRDDVEDIVRSEIEDSLEGYVSDDNVGSLVEHEVSYKLDNYVKIDEIEDYLLDTLQSNGTIESATSDYLDDKLEGLVKEGCEESLESYVKHDDLGYLVERETLETFEELDRRAKIESNYLLGKIEELEKQVILLSQPKPSIFSRLLRWFK